MKKNLILLGILVILGGAYFTVNYFSSHQAKDANIRLDFNSFAYSHIKSPAIEIQDGQIVADGVKKEADAEKLNTFIQHLKEIKVLQVASTNTENFETYGIKSDTPTLEIDGTKILLWALLGYSQEYVKLDTENTVYLIDTNLGWLLSISDAKSFEKTVTKPEDSATVGDTKVQVWEVKE